MLRLSALLLRLLGLVGVSHVECGCDCVCEPDSSDVLSVSAHDLLYVERLSRSRPSRNVAANDDCVYVGDGAPPSSLRTLLAFHRPRISAQITDATYLARLHIGFERDKHRHHQVCDLSLFIFIKAPCPSSHIPLPVIYHPVPQHRSEPCSVTGDSERRCNLYALCLDSLTFVPTSYLLTALGSSITNFLVELYMLLRLFSLPVPRRARLRDRLLGAKVLAITRVSSLVVFDALTVVPDAIATGIFAQFIPFSVGALIILGMFFLLHGSISHSSHGTM